MWSLDCKNLGLRKKKEKVVTFHFPKKGEKQKSSRTPRCTLISSQLLRAGHFSSESSRSRVQVRVLCVCIRLNSYMVVCRYSCEGIRVFVCVRVWVFVCGYVRVWVFVWCVMLSR